MAGITAVSILCLSEQKYEITFKSQKCDFSPGWQDIQGRGEPFGRRQRPWRERRRVSPPHAAGRRRRAGHPAAAGPHDGLAPAGLLHHRQVETDEQEGHAQRRRGQARGHVEDARVNPKVQAGEASHAGRKPTKSSCCCCRCSCCCCRSCCCCFYYFFSCCFCCHFCFCCCSCYCCFYCCCCCNCCYWILLLLPLPLVLSLLLCFK